MIKKVILKQSKCGIHPFLISKRYKLNEEVGKGSYGVVVSAFDQLKKEKVAIKKINNVFSQSKEYQKRILRELLILHHFKNHDNIINLKDLILPPSFQQFKDIYIVTDYMDTDLRCILRSSQKLSPLNIKFFFYQIVRAMSYIHSAGVIHRDIKPGNILINEDMVIKVCDFGLSRGFDVPKKENEISPEMSTAYVATRWYRAPELLLNWAPAHVGIDSWSLGCILGEFLSENKEKGGRRKIMFKGKNWLSQLNLILDTIGTPDESKEIKGCEGGRKYVRSYPKRKNPNWKKYFPNADDDALDLLNKLLQFCPEDRITCKEALKHRYFDELEMDVEKDCEKFQFRVPKGIEKGDMKSLMNKFICGYNKRVLEYDTEPVVEDSEEKEKEWMGKMMLEVKKDTDVKMEVKNEVKKDTDVKMEVKKDTDVKMEGKNEVNENQNKDKDVNMIK